jgi:hypothetical protein
MGGRGKARSFGTGRRGGKGKVSRKWRRLHFGERVRIHLILASFVSG